MKQHQKVDGQKTRRLFSARAVFLSVVLVVSVLLVGVGAWWYQQAMETTRQWLTSQLRQEIGMVMLPLRLLTRRAADETGLEKWSLFLEPLVTRSNLIAGVAVLDEHGRIRLSYGLSPDAFRDSTHLRSFRRQIRFGWDDQGGILPLSPAGGGHWMLAIRYDTAYLNRLRERMLLPVAGLTGGVMLLLFLLYALMEWLGIRPLQKVRQQLEEGAYVVSSTMYLKEFDYLVNALSRRMVLERTLRDSLDQQARTDALTRLSNRTGILLRMGSLIEQLRQQPEAALAVILVDLDGFKRINDIFGHEQGDRMLMKVSHILQQFVVSEDDLGRLGADQFLLLVRTTRQQVDQQLPALLSKINQAMNVMFDLPAGETSLLSASIGASVWPRDSEIPEGLMKAAEVAMYEAKKKGRNTAVIHDQTLNQRVQREAQIMNDIRRALEEGELYLALQPKIDLGRRNIAGFEVLARWRHPELGELSPGEFMPLINRSVYGQRFGLWMTEQALDFAGRIREAGLEPPSLSLNMQRLFLNEGFLSSVIQLAQERSLSPALLTLELLEGDFFGDMKQQDHRVLDMIHQHRIRLSIDDFGTGFSSLSYLQELDVDEIKVDRTFVSGLPEDRSLHLLQAIYGIAEALQLDVVVEGVETHAQLKVLYGMGFRIFQGFYFSRPLLVEQALAFYTADMPLEEKLRTFKRHFHQAGGQMSSRHPGRLSSAHFKLRIPAPEA